MAHTSKLTDKNQKWNFRTLLSQGVLAEISFQLTSPRLVLPFLYIALGAPVMFAGLLLPVVEISRLVAQMVAAPIMSAGLRKWYIALAMTAMAAALSVIAIASYTPNAQWLAILFLLVATIVGIAQGISSLAHQDLLGRVMPHHHRSTLLFAQAGLAGLFTIAIAWTSQHFLSQMSALAQHLELLWAGIVVALLAAVAIALVRESLPIKGSPARDLEERRTETGEPLLKEIYAQTVSAARIDWFRRFLFARALFLSVELAMPFYAVHAATRHIEDHHGLGAFVIASSLGLMLGGLIWHRVARVSVIAVLVLASVIASCGGVLAITLEVMSDSPDVWVYAGVFLLVMLGSQGIINARKLYIVNSTTDDERPHFVAVSKVSAGIAGVLLAFVFGALAHIQHVVWPIGCIIALNAAAALYATKLDRSPLRKFAGT